MSSGLSSTHTSTKSVRQANNSIKNENDILCKEFFLYLTIFMNIDEATFVVLICDINRVL